MTATILEKIVEAKRRRVETARAAIELDEMKQRASAARETSERYRFSNALLDRSPANIIAEFKRASPSRGIINDSVDPANVARQYRSGGAAAISVLTEEDFFKGTIDDLHAVRGAVDLPILRKDFVIDEFQIYESAAAGADAILLIVAALEVGNLQAFHSQADELGLDALVEVHDEKEMAIAADIGSRLIGVNNRNLHTFEVSLDVSRRLVGLAPPDALLVAESGIRTRNEVLELRGLGYSGFLVGESLMRSLESGFAVSELAG